MHQVRECRKNLVLSECKIFDKILTCVTLMKIWIIQSKMQFDVLYDMKKEKYTIIYNLLLWKKCIGILVEVPIPSKFLLNFYFLELYRIYRCQNFRVQSCCFWVSFHEFIWFFRRHWIPFVFCKMSTSSRFQFQIEIWNFQRIFNEFLGNL